MKKSILLIIPFLILLAGIISIPWIENRLEKKIATLIQDQLFDGYCFAYQDINVDLISFSLGIENITLNYCTKDSSYKQR